VKNTFTQNISPLMERLVQEGRTRVVAQFVASESENNVQPEELADPIGDAKHTPVKGITHRYPDRALLKASHRCAVHCRFCFRRNWVGKHEQDLSPGELAAALNYLAETKTLREVILSGGDPLVLDLAVLREIIMAINAMPHIRVLRIHTRVPVVAPERVTDALLELLNESVQTVWVVIHTDSAEEFTVENAAAIRKMRRAGIPLLAQSVLLKGVNATEADLEALFRRLFEMGIKPYYLHYPDLAQGTHHFRIPLEEALRLIQTLRERMSGIAVPTLALDIPAGQGKIAFAHAHPILNSSGEWEVKSPLTAKKVTIKYPSIISGNSKK
jgi:lysine 2,3-aminomutase